LQATGIAKSTYYRRKAGTKPRQAPVSEEIEEQVSGLSDTYPAFGHRAIAGLLNEKETLASDSTVYRVLKRLDKLQEPSGMRRE
jgi:hypothetical protein